MTNLSEMFTNSADLGTQDTTATNEGDLLFIGEGKKYANEVEADKAIAFKEDHIRKIEEENATLREGASKAATIDQVLESIKNQSQSSTTDTSATATTSETGTVDIDELVAKALDERMSASEHARVVEGNAHTVFTTLQDKYGERAGELYQAKANELGIDLDALAAISPKAVLEYFKEPSTPNRGSGYKDGTYNTANLTSNPQGQAGTFEYWNKKMTSGEISRDEAFKRQHESLQAMGAAKFYGQ